MVKLFVRLPQGDGKDEYAVKSRAHHQRVADPTYPKENMISYDIAKSYAGCMYQMHFGNQLDEFMDFSDPKNPHQMTFDWPVFSMYDLPQEVAVQPEYLRPGRYYLNFTKPVTIDGFPVASNEWYSHPEVWYFRNKTDAEFTITHQWVASHKVPYYIFRGFISQCRMNFPDAAKLMINMMYGMLGKDQIKKLKKYFTSDVAWAAFYMFRSGTPGKNHLEEKIVENGTINEETGEPNMTSRYEIKSKTITNMQNNAMPFHNQINGMGKIRLIHLYTMMSKIGPHRLIQLKTDSVTVEYEKQADRVKCKEFFKQSKFYRPDKYDPFNEVKECHVNEMPFKGLPCKEWNPTVEQPPSVVRDFLLAELAEDTPANNLLRNQIQKFNQMDGSFAIEGMPGVAKSHILKLIKKHYDEQNVKCLILTPTNAAACRFILEGVQAQTIHTGLFIDVNSGKSKQTPKNVAVLIIDEISMVPSDILETILEIKRAHDLIVITGGDWNQLDAVKDRVSIERRQNSRVYGDLVDWNKFTFTENIRSDNSMFNVYRSIAATQSLDQVKGWLNTRKTDQLMFKNICKTNDKRLEVISQCAYAYVASMQHTYPQIPVCEVTFQEHASGEKATNLKVPLVPNVTQGEKILHTMPLIAQTSDKKMNVIKGNRYYLKNWEVVMVPSESSRDGTRWMFNVVDDLYLAGKTTDILTLPYESFVKLMTLAFCVTTHKAQGVTIKEPYKIHEIDKFTWRMAYVALSRTTSSEHIFTA
jgi:hypothetical protein